MKVAERGRAVLFKGERVLLAAPPGIVAISASKEMAPQFHEPLFDRLRALRKRLADEREVPPYVVFHDSTLKQMAAELPASREHLRRLHGVGERKALDYGDAFLACVAEYVEETGAKPAEQVERPRPRRRGVGELGSTIRTTLDLFHSGQSPTEIAVTRGLAISTIEGHLAEAMEAGEQVDLGRLVGEEKRLAIESAIAELGPASLKPIMEKLGEGYSYGELRFVRASLGLAGSSFV